MSDHTSSTIDFAVRKLSLITSFTLESNRHRGTWSHLTPQQMLDGIKRETAELEKAIAHGNKDEIVHEIADVAAWAAMLLDVTSDRRTKP